MKKAGANILWDFTALSSVGIIESLYPAIVIFWKLRKLKSFLISKAIQVIVLIDNQGLNIQIAKLAKKMAVKVIYYFPPHVSIWGKGNAKLLADYCDLLLCPFYQDHQIYKAANANTLYTGHPLVQIIDKNKKEKTAATTIGLFPGSRKQELNKTLPIIMALLNYLKEESVRFYLVIASEDIRSIVDKKIDIYQYNNLELITQGDYEKYKHCDFAITSSGTVTLELALLEVPMIVVYKVNILTYWIAKYYLKIKYISMPNILLDEDIVPEFIQYDFTFDKVKKQIIKWLDEPALLESISKKLEKIRPLLMGPDNPIDYISQRIVKEMNEAELDFS